MFDVAIESEETLGFFKQRAEKTLANDRESIDQAILPIVDLLQTFPGIAPAWSCESHPEKEHPTDIYVTCVINETGADHIQAIYKAWLSILDKQHRSYPQPIKGSPGEYKSQPNPYYVNPWQVFIRINRLTWPRDFSRKYMVVKIGYHWTTLVKKEHALKTFTDAIKIVKESI